MPSESEDENDYHIDPQLSFCALEKVRLTKGLPAVSDTTLCKLCSDMSSYILRGEKYQHITNLWELPASATGCSFCSLIEQCIRSPTAVNRTLSSFADGLRIAGIGEDGAVQLVIRPDGNLLDLCFLRQGGAEEEMLTTSTIKLFKEALVSDEKEGVSLPLGMAVSSDPDLNNIGTLVRNWTEDCRLNHLDCNAPDPGIPSLVPARVLDLSHVHLTGQLRLLCTDNIAGKYITLSHSWGGHQPAKTLESNLAARCAGFPLSELPLTFRDAIAVAVELRVQYIWIDSLCIVQDDPDDWEREAANMGDIYLHSYLTIAATRAANSEAGFLGSRSFTQTVKLPGIAPGEHNSATGSVYACQRRSFSDDVDDGPLSRRAWVLQERVLSPRTVHFTERQVYWECWQHHQGEDLEYQYLGVMKRDAYPVGLSPSSLLRPKRTRSSELPQGWWYMSSEYTSCNLTFQTDKLIAIGGLVQKLGAWLHLTYVKGLYDYEPVSQFKIWEAGGMSHSRPPLIHATLAKLSPYLNIGDVRWSDPGRDSTTFPPELDYFATRYRPVQNHECDVVGWVTLDNETEPQIELSRLFWVLVAYAYNHEHPSAGVLPSYSEAERTRYCLLVQEDDDGSYKRVGVSSVMATRCLEYCNKNVFIS
ncbi:heterokaryon incompatibility protein-domain-containing protein [Nemania sp. FL0031]|nr:heterokaryon incompatibility protein-domain-containing protein [Nemania sp. FL0031]